MSSLLNNTSTESDVSSTEGQSFSAFAASLVISIVIFGVEVGVFLIIKDRFTRIYQPRTYLVPEKERTKAADAGWWKWIKPVLSTSNSEFIQKCGLDAYFFLRYLRTLLKIFVPAACVILPILLPLNNADGRGSSFAVGKYANSTNVTGLDQLAWGNVAPTHTHRYWAHWLCALALILYVCYVAFDELRGYIRMRQAYLTSPQHRLRASATTVLVSSIPHKWCNVEALEGLYDVFPGGLRNIWVNRNFDDLSAKIKVRDKLASTLEKVETNLIKKCREEHEKELAKEAKKAGKKITKEEKKEQDAIQDAKAKQNAQGRGLTTGNPHQVKHTVEDAVATDQSTPSSDSEGEDISRQHEEKQKKLLPVPILGDGVEAVTAGFSKFGRGVLGGLRKVEKDFDDTIDTTNGYVPPEPKDTDKTSSGARDFHETRGFGGKRKAKANDASATSDQLHNQYRTSDEAAVERPRQSAQTDTRPLNSESPTPDEASLNKPKQKEDKTPGKFAQTLAPIKKFLHLDKEKKEPIEYPEAYDAEFESDSEDATWRKYIKETDRETMRLPIFGLSWMPALPLMGPKVDTIYHCRKELARLNAEIEDDQAHPERFPLMNSAFIQFNHQVAAHMACQSLSHHLPKQMAPRLVEIAPNDVIWDNMSIPWWQRYVRTALVFVVVLFMIILWAIPVAFTSALSQLHYLADRYHQLAWILKLPSVILSVLQGVLPTAFLAVITFLLPIILRFLVRMSGQQSGMLVELSVQNYYFFFLFVQLFLVVSISSAAFVFLSILTDASTITELPNLLAENIPKASNYFFSYMLLQAMSVSAGALVQIGNLIKWFILAPILDSTARSKFNRQIKLNEVKWGTFFPVYTNLAAIGLIYSVISPLILVFNVITFSLFWFVYRYNTLYVTKFTRDTGGLLFPNAINCTFVGVYVLEVVLSALFFLVRDDNNTASCKGQGIGMIVILICTVGYQILLNEAFSPLFRYLPITLEDDAVRRDKEFERALNQRHGIIDDEEGNEDLAHALEDRERREREEDRRAEEIELEQINAGRNEKVSQDSWRDQIQNPEINMDVHSNGTFKKLTKSAIHKTAGLTHKTADLTINKVPRSENRHRGDWARPENNRRSSYFGQSSQASLSSHQLGEKKPYEHRDKHHGRQQSRPYNPVHALEVVNNFNPLLGDAKQLEEAQAARNQLSDALFGGVHDELEDLTADQRDALVQRAFQHAALRAKRPVIWIPRDDLGVSDDEIQNMSVFSDYLWVSNVRQGLDAKGRCVYSGAPPDFSEVDLIEL